MSKGIKIMIAGFLFVALFAFGGTALYKAVKKEPPIIYKYYKVGRTDLADEIALDGKVKPAEEVRLAFEKSAKVATANVKIGDKVKAGQILASLVSADLAAQLAQASAGVQAANAQLHNAEAAYQAQLAKLGDIQVGARPEDLSVSQTKIDNANKSIQDSKDNLANVENKAETDIDSLYQKTADVLNDAYAKAFDAVYTKTDGIFLNSLTGSPMLTMKFNNTQYEIDLINKMSTANNEIIEMRNDIDAMAATRPNVDQTIIKTKQHLAAVLNFLKETNDALNFAITSQTTTQSNILSYKNNLSAGLGEANGAMASVNSHEKAIAVQKALNTNQTASAEAQLNQAVNGLATANKEMALKRSGASKDSKR
jgi:multidrug efflux pump subunit AcrA (membrane-fusion protein)